MKRIKHSLPEVQAKLRRLAAKATSFAKWAEDGGIENGPGDLYIIGYTSRGNRVGRRYDRIADKYGII